MTAHMCVRPLDTSQQLSIHGDGHKRTANIWPDVKRFCPLRSSRQIADNSPVAEGGASTNVGPEAWTGSEENPGNAKTVEADGAIAEE